MDKDEVDWLYLLFGGKGEWEGGVGRGVAYLLPWFNDVSRAY